MAETINWVAALSALGASDLVRDVVERTLGALAKTPDDRELILGSLTAGGRLAVEPASP
jgi:hypothetical protein